MLEININLLWQFINFFILLYVLNIFLFKPVGEALKKRREEIGDLYRRAEEDRANAEALKQEHDERIRKIEAEMAEIKRNEIKEAQAQKEEIIEEARREAQDIVKKGELKLKVETDKIVDRLQDYISDLSIQIAGKILKTEIDANRHKLMISEFLEKVGEVEWQKRQ